MKKLTFMTAMLLTLILILTGCVWQGNSARIIDGGVMTEENSNLFMIPNEEIEQMMYPEMYLLGDNLLFFETEYPESEDSETDVAITDEYQPDPCIVRLKLISVKDGSLLAEREIDTMFSPMVQTGEECAAVYDTFSGEVMLLDNRLETVRKYSFEGLPLATAMLDDDLDTMYMYDYEQGLYRCNLPEGEKEEIISGYQLYPFSHTDNAGFSYVDKETQCNNYSYIDGATNTVCPLPSDMPADFCDRYGSVWLIRNKNDYYEYELVSEGKSYEIITDEKNAVLSDNGHLILCDDYCTEVELYDLDGGFVSSLTFEDECEYRFLPNEFLWSDVCGGYFFTENLGYGAMLMFLDPYAVVSGSDLPLETKSDELPAGEILSPELYERAAQLSEKYDLDIRVGEQCELDYAEQYSESEIMTDSGKTEEALDVLERALECYPEGFFSQLRHGDISEIRIEIVAHMSSAIGFVQQKDDHYLVAVDGVQLTDYVIFHEFSHVIDNRLEWDAEYCEESVYSEEQWRALQPEGFEYACTYDISTEFREKYFDTDYFVMPYALSYPTEDRAVLMGTAMDEDYHALILENGKMPEGLHNKLEYYSRCIRYCFDTEGWPEVTEWEELLTAE